MWISRFKSSYTECSRPLSGLLIFTSLFTNFLLLILLSSWTIFCFLEKGTYMRSSKTNFAILQNASTESLANLLGKDVETARISHSEKIHFSLYVLVLWVRETPGYRHASIYTCISIYIWGHFEWSISPVTDKTKLLIRTRTQFEVTDLKELTPMMYSGETPAFPC